MLEPPKGKKPDDWEPRPQTLFRATEFGDDVDRPLKKSDGTWTYFATDIAYHEDKAKRGFNTMIDVWGADHGGYVKRMQAAVKALSNGEAELDVKLCQLVKLIRGGEPVKMSKRAGNFVTLRERGRRGRQGRAALHHADPQERRAARISTWTRSWSSRATIRCSMCSPPILPGFPTRTPLLLLSFLPLLSPGRFSPLLDDQEDGSSRRTVLSPVWSAATGIWLSCRGVPRRP